MKGWLSVEYTKEDLDSIYMNIENFSKAISENWKVNAENLKDYIFSNISVGLVKNQEMKKDINKLFVQHRLKYYNATINSSCINHAIMTQGTLEQEIEARKVLGILIAAESDYNLRSAVVKLLRKYYPVIFNSVKKLNKKQLKEKYSQMDSLGREIEARVDAAVYFYFAIYRSAEIVDQGFIISIINDMKAFELSNPIMADIDRELENHRAEVQEIKAIIKREYGKLSSYKDILSSENDYVVELSIILENMFIINKLDINYIFKNSEFLNIDKIILAYIKADKKTMDVKEIIQVIINGIFIQSIINEYKNSRKLYFENNVEMLYDDINNLEAKFEIVQEENNEIKYKLQSLEEEKKLFNDNLNSQISKLNKLHKLETNELENRIKELENQLSEEHKYRSELNTLREYIFEVNNEYSPKTTERSLKEYIVDKKLLIIGGAKDWRRKFREKYPQIRDLNGFNDGFDISILMAADYVFFYTGFMSHATYNKAMGVIRNNQIKFGYIGKTNIELVEEELIEEIQRLSISKN
jgi:hypothetical protein